jgi:hypothetical protein
MHSRVDFNEVVSVLLVNQELGCACISVIDRLCKLYSISEDGITSLDGQILGWCKLDNLLMASLNTAITLVQMDHVSMVVAEKLDFNVLGSVQKALHKDGAVAESRLGFGCSSLKGILQFPLLADDTHTTATTSEGGLDDDWEAIFISE